MRTLTPRPRSATRLRTIGLLAVLAVLAVAPAASAHHRGGGAVYTQTNAATNELVMFDRAADGTLRERGRVATGGAGEPAGPPILDSQGSVELTDDERLIFVVNAGSDTVSSFRVRRFGLPRLVDQEATNGDFPLSVDSLASSGWHKYARRGLAYVLNERSGSIFGYRYRRNGRLDPIAGSWESLSVPGGAGRAAQIGFKGRTLTVSRRGPDVRNPTSSEEGVDTFLLGADDTPGAAIANTVPGGPFGFAYDSANHLIISDSHVDTASSYALAPSGALSLINTAGPTGIDPCWVVITPDDRFVFTTDAVGEGTDPPIGFGPGTITRFSLGANGTLTRLGPPQTFGSPGLATDAALSPDGRFLYVVKPDPFGTESSKIDTLRVGADGGLTFVGATATTLPLNTSGLATTRR